MINCPSCSVNIRVFPPIEVKTIQKDGLLCISTSFWVLRAPKSWSKHFCQPFSNFVVHFKAFTVISRLKSTKNVWKRTKKRDFVYSSKLVDMQKLKNSWKKCFDQLLGGGSTLKLVKIHNNGPYIFSSWYKPIILCFILLYFVWSQ